MKIGFLYGKWSTAIHGPFDLDGLYHTRGLTGSESAFWNIIRTLAERNHDVHVSCPTTATTPQKIACGANVIPLAIENDKPVLPMDCDAYISWNEPDLLRLVPSSALRIHNHQINDFRVFYKGWEHFVDLYILVSESHRRHILEEAEGKINPSRTHVIPNSIEPAFYYPHQPEPRTPGSIAFTSSPDRGLFRMIDLMPGIRQQVPQAKLHVFYEWKKIYDVAKERTSLNSLRFKFMAATMERMISDGVVQMHGFVSNAEMAKFLQKTRVFAYPCEPIRYTEGFSVGTMDACAAGCVPIISDADALPEIYAGAVEIIKGKPGLKKKEWTNAVVKALTDDEYASVRSNAASTFARKFTRQLVADEWEHFLSAAIAAKPRTTK